MALPSPLPRELIELIATRFRMLGEPMRIAALDHLREAGEDSVGNIAEALETSQQNVSKHLNALQSDGILTRRRDGNRTMYSIADPSVLAICEVVCDGLRRRNDQLTQILEAAT